MKIDIISANCQKVFDFPPGVHFVGVMVIYNGVTFNVLYHSDDVCTYNEEIVLDENLKIVFRYYNGSKAEEVLKAFAGYEGIKCIEIKNTTFSLCVCI